MEARKGARRGNRQAGSGSALALVLCVLIGAPAAAQTDPALAGSVRYYSSGVSVEGATLQLSGIGSASSVTDANGAYAFADPGVGNWQLQPSKLGGTNTAISALDASQVLEAVVGLRDFSDLQRLACDVTGDGTVSALDAARILQLISGTRVRLPIAETCASDWAFFPDPAMAPNQHVLPPQMAPACAMGGISYEPLMPPLAEQNFLAVVFGDCTGNWQPAAAEPSPTPTAPPLPTDTATAVPPPSETPTDVPATVSFTATAVPTATHTALPTATHTFTPVATATHTAVPTTTRTFTNSPTPSRTGTATPPPATGTRTRTFTRTATPTKTVTNTPASTATRTQTPTQTATRTQTPTRTATITLSPTPSVTATPTRTGTRTQTPTPSFTATPTPTQTCQSGLAWNVSSPVTVSTQSGGSLWLTRTVPTDSGWGVFWLRNDPSSGQIVRLYYAHVAFNGQLTAGPMAIKDIPRMDFRGHYYFAAWHTDHFAVLTAERETLFYHNMTPAGVLSGRRSVGPPLFVDPQFDQECDGEIDAYPGGFQGVIEGECAGHSCAYAFRLDPNGVPTTSVFNLVDFDFTHQFFPHQAYDGVGFNIVSVKDIKINEGGLLSKYWPIGGTLSSHTKVVPSKQYLWDEFPDLAWNGNHFAALWTENSARSWNEPWQIHFATFRRTATTSVPIADRVIDMTFPKTNHRWTTQVHPMAGDWVAQYTSRSAGGSLVAVYEFLGSDANTGIVLEPFNLSADALGSSPHFAAGHQGVLGIARGSNDANSTTVQFYTLPPPGCQ